MNAQMEAEAFGFGAALLRLEIIGNSEILGCHQVKYMYAILLKIMM